MIAYCTGDYKAMFAACLLHFEPLGCNTLPACEWNGFSCNPFNCDNFFYEGLCRGNGCVWIYGYGSGGPNSGTNVGPRPRLLAHSLLDHGGDGDIAMTLVVIIVAVLAIVIAGWMSYRRNQKAYEQQQPDESGQQTPAVEFPEVHATCSTYIENPNTTRLRGASIMTRTVLHEDGTTDVSEETTFPDGSKEVTITTTEPAIVVPELEVQVIEPSAPPSYLEGESRY
jgi:hypothetical protein